ncbi:hypothetical protein [Streptomyces roseoviridis]|uniref:Uncharacterized protein n=1 Tax=Streptomyces roseoviridis TaxID=67361 RepID=A0ABV5QWW6_9ACTN
MSQEAAPERAVPEQGAPQVPPAQPSAESVPSRTARSVPEQGGAPKGLLQQMEELMAALTADLTQLDADLQSSADRQSPASASGTPDHPDVTPA